MKRIARRDFLKGSLTALAAGGSLAMPFSRVRGANNDICAAVVGIRSQGTNHINWFRNIPGVRVVAICDADKQFLDREEQKFKERNETVDTYVDCRKLLEDKDIDVVITAAPNHWHALITIWACQAGKDVYVEKPVSHNIWEGRQMVNAARKYNRIVQAGTQRRSDTGLAEAVEYIKQGNLGKIRVVHGIVYVERGSIGKVNGPQPIPQSVDYNLWCGPASMTPLMRKSLHYDWHWAWPTGNGDFGNNGIHYIDVCRWFIGADKVAPRVLSIGGRFGYIDDGETPNTQIVLCDYKPASIIFEVRGLPRAKGDPAMDQFRGTRGGAVVQCEGGYFVGGWAYDNDGKKIKQFKTTEGSGHHANFIKAVRSRNKSDLNAEILDGYLSTALCHMGNISYRLGKIMPPGQIAEAVKANEDLADSFDRMEDHLKANQVDFNATPRILGPALTMDPDKEIFVGDFSKEANMFLSRNYREPFVVPEIT
ncbi:MAG: Gfo/Idh/MocA family oxidoreductase [Sedimentisphaerales bacterium]|nr:Gfo/Idh/MocA family oxidoreductase [Sedimentisphaerales bacterium]